MAISTESPLEPPPRKAGLRRGIKNVRRAYRTIFALVIVVFSGWAILDGFRWYNLVYRTQVAEGKTLKKQVISGPAGHYRVEYRFVTSDGADIEHETSVSLAMSQKLAEGQPVAVVYLADNPKVDHWLFDNTAARTHVMYLTLGHGIAALLAIIIWRMMEQPLGKELRLARRGHVADGRILSIGKARGRRGIVRISYSFHSSTGAAVEGACNLPRRFPAHILEVGMTLEILYDANKPRINKPRIALDHIEFGDGAKKNT